MYAQEVLKQIKIHALNVNKVSIKTIQLIQSSESQDDQMDIEWVMKNVMMEMTTMEMDAHQIAMLKEDGIELVKTALKQINDTNVQ